MIRVTIAIVCTFLVAGCGGRSKLSDEQKTELTALLESTGRSQRATQALSYSKVRDEVLDSSSPQSKVDESAQLMAQKLTAATCDRTQFIPDTDSGSLISKPQKKGYVVEGAGCPVSYHFLVTTDQTQKDHTNVHVDLHYAVADESFRALNDVVAYSLTGDLQVDRNDSHGSLRGNVESQASGNVPMEIDLSTSSLGGELALRWEFPKFSVEMKAVGHGGKIEYSINGETITATQFLQTLAKAGPAFAQFVQVNAGSTAGSPSSGTEDAKPQVVSGSEIPDAVTHPAPPPQTN